MTVTITLLRRDHINFSLILNTLERQIDAAEQTRIVSPQLFKLAFRYFRDYPRLVHHPKEDLIYGALLRHFKNDTSWIFRAIDDHREMGDYLVPAETALAAVNNNDPISVDRFCDAARKFITHERAHMEMEEAHLYPSAVRLVPPEEWEMIESTIDNSGDPTFGDEACASYDRLIAEILLRDGAARGLDKL